MQEESARNWSPEARRLVLGFDAGCLTCSDLAFRIEERVGEQLDVRNLRDPELQGWREEVLGEDASWAPTLFEINGDQVRAWTGWRMGWALSRTIGPAATWQVMQALGGPNSLGTPGFEDTIVLVSTEDEHGPLESAAPQGKTVSLPDVTEAVRESFFACEEGLAESRQTDLRQWSDAALEKSFPEIDAER